MTISVCVCVYEEWYSLNIHEVSVTVEDEVRNAGIFLLTAVPEGKLRQETRISFVLMALDEKSEHHQNNSS